MMRDWGLGVRGLAAVGTVGLTLLVLVGPVRACETDGRYIMGTVFQATLCQAEIASQQQQMSAVWHALFTTARRFDALFTTYAPHSPLSHLNAQAGQGFRPFQPKWMIFCVSRSATQT